MTEETDTRQRAVPLTAHQVVYMTEKLTAVIRADQTPTAPETGYRSWTRFSSEPAQTQRDLCRTELKALCANVTSLRPAV